MTLTPPAPPDRDYVIVDSRKGCMYYLFLSIVLCLVSFAACAVLPFLAPAPSESSEGAKLEEHAPDAPARTWIKREGIR